MVLLLFVLVGGGILVSGNFHAEPESAVVESEKERVVIELSEPAIFAQLIEDDEKQLKTMDKEVIQSTKQTLQHKQQAVLNDIEEASIHIEISHEYAFTFNGLASEVSSDDITRLEKVPGVEAIHKDETFYINLEDSVPLIGAPEVWEKEDEDGQSLTGEGMTVAIIDSGIDYNHPDLGNGFGSDYKVVDGYNFINDSNDPMDDNGHGTHVAGIVAGNGEMTGVAPDANLTAYKVMNSSGRGNTSDIIAAIERAADPENPHRADVINMSLGGPGDENSPLSQASNLAVQSGVVVIVSSGNSGPGKHTVTAPGNATDVLTVGASMSGVNIPEARIVSPVNHFIQSNRLSFSASIDSDLSEVEVVDVGRGTPEEFEGKDVTGKMVLSLNSPGNFNIASLAEEHGASGILFYYESIGGNGPGFPFENSSENEYEKNGQHQFSIGPKFDGRLNIIALEIDQQSGELIKRNLADDQVVNLELTETEGTDLMADFSSRGPTENFHMKPEIVAPGVEILSTMPEDLFEGGYYRYSGTSMAAPHVAGAAAILAQQHSEWNAGEIQSALVSSAHQLPDADPITQGAGRLDVNQASETELFSMPDQLSFQTADLHQEEVNEQQQFKLVNKGDEQRTYQLSHQMYSKDELEEYGVTVSVEPETVTLERGETSEIEVSISMDQPHADLDVMGWIEATPVDDNVDETIHIPFYLGVQYMQIHLTPEPAYGATEAFIYSPLHLEEAPVLSITAPSGKTMELEAEFSHDYWWRIPVVLDEIGAYKIEAEGASTSGKTLRGNTVLESLSVEGSYDQVKWQATGPYGAGSTQLLNPSKDQWTVSSPVSPTLFQSDDDMQSWKELRNLPVPTGWPSAAVTNPLNSNHMYVAINGRNDPTYEGKLLATTDDGKSWSTLPFPDIQIDDLIISHDGSSLVALTNQEIHISADNGKSWKKVPGAWNQLSDMHMDGDDLFFVQSDSVYVVRNAVAGNLEAELLFSAKDGSGSVITGEDGKLVFVTNYPNHLYVSTDYGDTWEHANELSSRPFQVIYENKKITVITLNDMKVSSDLGESWEEWELPQKGSIVYDIVFSNHSSGAKNETAYLASELDGIYKTENSGDDYERMGIPSLNVYDLAVTNRNGTDYLLAGTQWEIYESELSQEDSVRQPELEWGKSGYESTMGATARHVAVDPEDHSIVYKVIESAQSYFYIYKSVDYGETWTRKLQASEVPYDLYIHPADSSKLFVPYWSLTGRGIYVSEDAGETWSTISFADVPMAVAGDPNDANKFWVGTEGGLFLTTDGGTTFTNLSEEPVQSIAVNPDNPNHLVVGGEALFVSGDGGKTLEQSDYLDIRLSVSDLVFQLNDSNIVYAATDTFQEADLTKRGRGVLRSTDGGKSWHSFSNGLNNLDTTSLELSPNERELFVGTRGGSVYRISLENVDDIISKE
ncbi:S8 family serine peptidase [Virgibacillus oceani]